MLTREQEYAAKIYTQVAGVEAKYQSEYRAMAEKLPVLIRTAGLAHALHFASSRSEAAKKLVNHLAEVVKRDDILDASRKAELGEYMRLTQQALAALQWYKRFAQSLLSDESVNTRDKKKGGETI
jgi:CRISPR-associated protein Cmr5